jgi:hypothetical protein
MQLEDDEREADYQALIASVQMCDDMFDEYPGDPTMNLGTHILYKAELLR